ncbi:MAG: tRNA (guanosine(37)-N1)-methyltransferase TrmD [Proteobacteria bacterium]|nr:MAG: tRNA (guanosine(37)-N1)-methyltransferase TrmD [Pseudomonadota bacterium]
MQIIVLTIFPEIFSGFLSSSLIEKAISKSLLSVSCINPRDYADPPHYQVDDSPYGGGAGMVMKPEPLARAIEAAKQKASSAKVVLLSAAGTPFSQKKAEQLSTLDSIILVCGRYEGIDQRVIDLLVDEEISIGDYVLMGGEVPAMAVIEATVRLMKNVVGNSESLQCESFTNLKGDMLLEAPHYTRPAEFRGRKVPEILLSGDHNKVEKWRDEQSKILTAARRPDLLSRK